MVIDVRLIDADALKKKFINANAEGINLAIDRYALKCIDDAPTIEPERKTGRWMRTDAYPHRRYCSVCFATFIRNDEFLKLDDIPHNYCPNCGANMRGEKDALN